MENVCFLSIQKNASMVPTEMGMRSIINTLRQELPGPEQAPMELTPLSKSEGIVSCIWKPLLRIVSPNSTTSEFQWNLEVTTTSNANYEEVTKTFNEDPGCGADVEWSRT